MLFCTLLPCTWSLSNTTRHTYIIMYIYIYVHTNIVYSSIDILYFSEAGFKCFGRQGAQRHLVRRSNELWPGIPPRRAASEVGNPSQRESGKDHWLSQPFSTVRITRTGFVSSKSLSTNTQAKRWVLNFFFSTWRLGSLMGAGSPLQKASLLLSGLSSMPLLKKWLGLISDDRRLPEYRSRSLWKISCQKKTAQALSELWSGTTIQNNHRRPLRGEGIKHRGWWVKNLHFRQWLKRINCHQTHSWCKLPHPEAASLNSSFAPFLFKHCIFENHSINFMGTRPNLWTHVLLHAKACLCCNFLRLLCSPGSVLVLLWQKWPPFSTRCWTRCLAFATFSSKVSPGISTRKIRTS